MPFKIKFLIFSGAFLWCGGVFYQPLISLNKSFAYAYPFVKKTFSMFCHQDKSKLFNFFGYETLTCSRCTGIYLGALLVSFILLFISLKKELDIKYLFLSLIPMIVDIILYTSGIYSYNTYIALATGFLLGSTGILYLYTGISNLLTENKLLRKAA